MCRMHLAAGMCTRCVHANAKPHNKAAARCECHALFCHTCRTRLKCVQDMFGKCTNVTLELSCTVTCGIKLEVAS